MKRRWMIFAVRMYQRLFEGKYELPASRLEPKPQFIKDATIRNQSIHLVHISDLHIGRHSPEKLRYLKTALQGLDPHFLVVSGDIVHEPTEENLVLASSVMKELRSYAKYSLIVPGNHDRHGELDLEDWAKHMGDSAAATCQCRVYELGDQFVFFFLLNSTVARTGDWLSQQIHDIVQVRGWIEPEQMEWLRQTRNWLLENRRTEYIRGLKVAVLHHHLIPVGSEAYVADAFMTLGNANAVLKLLAEMKVDLVLHGHKHVPAVRTLEMREQNHVLTILSAGAATAFTTTQEEAARTMSVDCSFFDISAEDHAVTVKQFTYANQAGFPDKFKYTRQHLVERRLPKYSRHEIDLLWTIDFPSLDWEMSENYLIERANGVEQNDYKLAGGCTVEAKFSDLGIQVERHLNGHRAQAEVDGTPEVERLSRGQETSYFLEIPLKLTPGLARGLDNDVLTLRYRWPKGFVEFENRSYVDGMWDYPWDIDRFSLTVRFTGNRRLKALRILTSSQREPIEGTHVSGAGGGFSCEVKNVAAGEQIIYAIERD
jgi:predicted phosphodiesterase